MFDVFVSQALEDREAQVGDAGEGGGARVGRGLSELPGDLGGERVVACMKARGGWGFGGEQGVLVEGAREDGALDVPGEQRVEGRVDALGGGGVGGQQGGGVLVEGVEFGVERGEEKRRLVGKVVEQGAGGDADVGGERAHGERVETLRLEDLRGTIQDQRAGLGFATIAEARAHEAFSEEVEEVLFIF